MDRIRFSECQAVAGQIHQPGAHLVRLAEAQAWQASRWNLERDLETQLSLQSRRFSRGRLLVRLGHIFARSRNRQAPALPEEKRLGDIVRGGGIVRGRRGTSTRGRLNDAGLDASFVSDFPTPLNAAKCVGPHALM